MRIPRSRRWIRIERHPQGPRVYALGRRIHEFEVGFAASAVLLAGWMADRWGLSLPTATAASCAVWLVVKDWRDIFRSRRDTGAWCLGLHRRWTAATFPPPRASAQNDEQENEDDENSFHEVVIVVRSPRSVVFGLWYYQRLRQTPVSSRGQDTWFSATGPGFESPYRYQPSKLQIVSDL